MFALCFNFVISIVKIRIKYILFSKTNVRFEISTSGIGTCKILFKDWKGDNKGFHPI